MGTVKKIKTMKDVPKEELLTGGTFACSGCGAVAGMRLALKALGKNTIMVNASGCMTLTTTYPFTPYKIPWVHDAIENSASTASGILMGLKALKKDKDINILVWAGDGATYDIGFQSLSGMVERGEKIIYVCYNNGSFGNTGFQKSGGTPYGAKTSTTPPGKLNDFGNQFWRKPMTKIMAAHGNCYVATANYAYPFDFFNKLKKASEFNGPSYIEYFSPCVPGMMIEDDGGYKLGKLAHLTGVWPLYEYVDGVFNLIKIDNRKPISEYFAMQGRYKHLNKKQIKYLQSMIDNEWENLNSGDFFESKFY